MDIFDLDVEELRKRISKKPYDAMLHFQLAKKLFSKPLDNLESIEEIKKELNAAIKLSPKLYMARFYLGRLFFLLKQYEEAKKEFRKVLELRPESILAKEYLAKCLSTKSAPPKTSKKSKKIEKHKDKGKESVRDIFYMFENSIRCFIEEKLKEGYGNDWWRASVPKDIRASCAARREEGLEEEKDLMLLHFADFHDYRRIIEKNKKIFGRYLANIKEWESRLSELEPIRNALAHSRLISQEAEKKVKEYCSQFQHICRK